MNLRQLECFFAVVDELHFAKAAARLFRSQASVSESIRILERELGGDLFVRTTRSVELTEFGERCARRMRPPYETLLGEFRALRRPTPSHAVMIALTPELNQFILPHLVGSLLKNQTPELANSWTSRVMHTQDQVEAVLEGSVGVGICWQPRPQPGLEIVPLAQCPLTVILAATDELAQSSSVTFQDLRDRRILLSPARYNPSADAMVRRAMSAAGLNALQGVEVASYEEIALGVIAGAGVGLHPATIIPINRLPGLVFRALESSEESTVDICAIRRSGITASPLTQTLAALVGAVSEAMATVPLFA